jgi:hypothetical protein
MTESEARAALKAEMPWAYDVGAIAEAKDTSHAHVWAGSKHIHVECNAPTLRAAVAKAIRAWRATQVRRADDLEFPAIATPIAKKKGAKR